MPNSEEHPHYDSLKKVIRNHNRGVICPAEMWGQIFTNLPPEAAWGFLDSLPDPMKLTIRRDYFGRSWFRFQPPQPTADLEVAQVIAQWCEQQGDPGATPES